MHLSHLVSYFFAGLFIISLSACGGSGGGGSDSTPSAPTNNNSSSAVLSSSSATSAVLSTSSEASTVVISQSSSSSSLSISSASATNSLTASSIQNLKNQLITFSRSEVSDLFVGNDPWFNSITTEGPGALHYSSSNPLVASVSSNGLITALNAGKTIITATKEGNGEYAEASASYSVTVNPIGQVFDFEKTLANGLLISAIQAGETLSNPATGTGTGAISYASSNTDIATVDNNGLVTAIGAGDVDIRASIESDANHLGNSKSYRLTIKRNPQIVSFLLKDEQKMLWGDSLKNPLMIKGKGAVIYQTNNPAIATVDEQGMVKAVGIGSTEITATAIQTPQYEQAWAKYTVTNKPRVLTFSGTHNHNGATLFIDNSAHGMDFTTPYTPTWNVLQPFVFQIPLSLNSTISPTPVDVTLRHGNHITITTAALQEDFLARHSHQAVAYKNRLWIFGGRKDQDQYCYPSTSWADAWSTVDGVSWTREAIQLDFLAENYITCQNYQVVVFNNQLWLIGTSSSGNTYIRASTDGIKWELKALNNPLPALQDMRLITHNNQLWMLGHTASNPTQIQIWSSNDGISWAIQNNGTQFSNYSNLRFVSFNNKLWIMQGGTNSFSGIWSSTDGKSWQLETSSSTFSARTGHDIVYHNGYLWMSGGTSTSSTTDQKSDLWVSSNGITWNQLKSWQFSNRTNHKMVVVNNRIWLTGGISSKSNGNTQFLDYNLTSDLWISSNDGFTWAQVNNLSKFAPRKAHQTVSFKNELWVIGGLENDSDMRSTGSIWSTKDTFHWTSHPPLPGLGIIDHQVTVHNNALWSTGGTSNNTMQNYVYYSEDGDNWITKKPDATFIPRAKHQAFSFNNKLWVVGGYSTDAFKLHPDTNNLLNDIWSSTDGINWTKEVSSAEFSPRSGHQVVLFNNTLFLIGGYDGQTTLRDIWSSTDAIHWKLETAQAPFSARTGHTVTQAAGRLWLMGGVNASQSAPFWSSTDGINWQQEPFAATMSRIDHQFTFFNNDLYLTGGLDIRTGWINTPRNTLTNDVWKYTPFTGVSWSMQFLGEFEFRN